MSSLEHNSIFLADNCDSDELKISYSNVMETIPEKSTHIKLSYKEWSRKFKYEWRWRFLEFENDISVVEISYISTNSSVRLYYNNKGEWVERDIQNVYDDYVSKTYYHYTNSL